MAVVWCGVGVVWWMGGLVGRIGEADEIGRSLPELYRFSRGRSARHGSRARGAVQRRAVHRRLPWTIAPRRGAQILIVVDFAALSFEFTNLATQSNHRV